MNERATSSWGNQWELNQATTKKKVNEDLQGKKNGVRNGPYKGTLLTVKSAKTIDLKTEMLA